MRVVEKMTPPTPETIQGILPINKEEKVPSFRLVTILRKLTKVRKIGHAGTLDPLASGVMILLIGRNFTKKSSFFLNQDKEYLAKICLGMTTSTSDLEGKVLTQSNHVPSPDSIEQALTFFQGECAQIPPMFSAKKVGGEKLYLLARKGIEIERKAALVHLKTTLIAYSYPYVDLHVQCSAGTYIRSLAFDLGEKLGCGGFLYSLKRTRVGRYTIEDCTEQKELFDPNFSIQHRIQSDVHCS